MTRGSVQPTTLGISVKEHTPCLRWDPISFQWQQELPCYPMGEGMIMFFPQTAMTPIWVPERDMCLVMDQPAPTKEGNNSGWVMYILPSPVLIAVPPQMNWFISIKSDKGRAYGLFFEVWHNIKRLFDLSQMLTHALLKRVVLLILILFKCFLPTVTVRGPECA